MKEIDTQHIKRLTNQKIAFANYEREELNKMKKLKTTILTMGIVALLAGGTITVDALTDNSISNSVGNAIGEVLNSINVKVNGKDYNSSCEKQTDGTYKCTIGKEFLGDDAEIVVEKQSDITTDIEVNNTDDSTEVSIDIK